ncbi:MAG: MBL fold metallo-hydrolase, partial [Omnitrophica bacterium]|nr:MBL fold metallo-hydrolase [Candidatus Omnitrophota bacterium]
LKRNASGLIVKIENENLLFDTGPGIIRKLLELGITYHDIDYIFYTHFHTDHTLDLATFLFAAKYALSLRTKRLTVIGPKGLGRFYTNLLSLYTDVISPEDYKVALREITEQTLDFGAYKITTMPMLHAPESLGYRIESAGKTVVYSGDTDSCENIVKLGQGADVLILDCSFPDQMKVKGHLTAGEAGQIAKECKCKKLVLSHLYPVCRQEQIAEQAKKTFKGKVAVAQDLMTICP